MMSLMLVPYDVSDDLRGSICGTVSAGRNLTIDVERMKREGAQRPLREIPYLTSEQMREVDRLMVDKYGIELMQMMENAGRHLAALARDRFLDGDPTGRHIVILAGSGGNGGGGLVAARRLHAWGGRVRVLLSRPPREYRGVPAHQLAILGKLDIRCDHQDDPPPISGADLVIDALIGYSLRGDPRGATASLIRRANESSAPVLSLDLPSGLDATTGDVKEPAVRADATLTLALPKAGLRAAASRAGELYLADIGVPPELYSEPSLGLDVGPIFARQEILRL
jgi:NAD(P)H-hydrate epimerase